MVNLAHFVVIYVPGRQWKPGVGASEQDLSAHVSYLQTLSRRGRLMLAGPFRDDSGGLAIVLAANLEEARRILASDPAVVRGVLDAELIEWTRVV